MDVSVIVISWNTRALLERCLASVDRALGDLAGEIIVVDNGSTDGSVAMVSENFPRVTLLLNAANRGFAAANNQAIRVSHGRYVLLLNSDTVLVGDAIQPMVKFLDARPATGIVGGQLLNPNGSFQWSYADFPGVLQETLLLTGLSRWVCVSPYPSHPESESQERRSVDWVSGAFLMARRQAIDAVGFLDEDYFMYAEEVDWCYRMKQHQWDVHYLPESWVIHFSGGSSQQAPERKRAQLYRSKWLFQRKHNGRLAATSFRLLVCCFSVAKLLGWAASGLTTNMAQRRRARRNIASYRYLLANF